MGRVYMTDSVDSYRRRKGVSFMAYLEGGILIFFALLFWAMFPFMKTFSLMLIVCSLFWMFVLRSFNKKTKKKFGH